MTAAATCTCPQGDSFNFVPRIDEACQVHGRPATSTRPPEPVVLTHHAVRPLCLGDLRRLVAEADRLGLPDDAPASTTTPISRPRYVGINIHRPER